MAEKNLVVVKIVSEIVLERLELLQEGANQTGFIDYKNFRTTLQIISELLHAYLDFINSTSNDDECLFLCDLLALATAVWKIFIKGPITKNMDFNELINGIPYHDVYHEITTNWSIIQSIFEMAQNFPHRHSISFSVISREEDVYKRIIEPAITQLKEKTEVISQIRVLSENELENFFRSQTFSFVAPGEFIQLKSVSSLDGTRVYLNDSLLYREDNDFQLAVELELTNNLSRFQIDKPESQPAKNGRMEDSHCYKWEAYEIKDYFRPSPFHLSKQKNKFKF